MSTPSRAGLSHNASRNASFYNANNDPSTPRQPREPELQMPPVPRHTSLRLRRARLDLANSAQPYRSAHHAEPNLSSGGLSKRSPRSTPRRFLDLHDPQTPQAQIRQVSAANKAQHDTIMSDVPVDEAPGSVRSAASNSSANSIQSTHPSDCEDCTSPESEMQDPFDAVAQQFSDRREYLETPSKPERYGLRNSAASRARTVKWTRDMDNHLWTTYNEFLQDPTITPFKMLPGTLPPLGVSYRVAREARKTWPKYKPQRGPVSQRTMLSSSSKACARSRDTESGPDNNVTPKASDNVATFVKPAWPNSDASTRRRLKELCKRKFSIAPHYQRLIRSPSPKPGVPASDTTGLDTELIRTDGEPLYTEAPATSSPFATRDLGISLIAGSAPQEPRLPPVSDLGEPVSENWFNELNMQAPDGTATDETVVPQSQLDSQGAPASGRDVPRLGSPFMYNTSEPDELPQEQTHTERYSKHDPMARLRPSAPDGRSTQFGSPNHLTTHSGVPRSSFSESFRFQRGRWNHPNSHHEPKSADNSKPVMMGASDSQRKLKQLFTPSSISGPASAPDSLNHKGILNSSSPPLLPLQGGDIARLGSPFKLNDTNGPHSQGSEPPSSAAEKNAESADDSSSTVNGVPHDHATQ